jgi:hypothetical protein
MTGGVWGKLFVFNSMTPGRNGAFLDFAVMLHSDDDISLFVSFIDIPVRLNNLLPRIATSLS